MDEGIYGVCVEGRLTYKQLVQDHSQRPQVNLHNKLSEANTTTVSMLDNYTYWEDYNMTGEMKDTHRREYKLCYMICWHLAPKWYSAAALTYQCRRVLTVWLYGCSCTSSGAMYSGVPLIEVSTIVLQDMARAKPKSQSLTTPFAPIKMF